MSSLPQQLDLLGPDDLGGMDPSLRASNARHRAPWLHPEATHEVRLGDVRVAYQLKRVQRRSIGIVVTHVGLCVRAPRWAGLGQIEQALRDRADWLCRKLADQQARARQMQEARLTWADGSTVPWRGQSILLRLGSFKAPHDTGTAPRRATPRPCTLQRNDDDLQAHPTLWVDLPPQASGEQVRDAVHTWMQHEALSHFHDRVGHFQVQLGVQVRALKLSSARSRWGSASADGTVRLHWKLMHFSPAIIDYVVAHELAHLKEMNHSPRFWAVVRSVLPEVDVLKREMRQLRIPE